MRNLSPQRSPNQETLQDQAKAAYQTGDFEEALKLYRTTLSSDARDKKERQLLLSNIVACRLNIGGKAQAEAAVENAKQCIALDDQWAKGHVRLAEAYIALGRGHSNDACNSLQRAIQLDPGHPTARQMLVRELRRDHRAAAADVNREGSTSEDASNNTTGPSETYAPVETERSADTINRQSSVPSSAESSNSRVYDDVDDPPPYAESPSFLEQLQMNVRKTVRWYHAQSEDRRTMIHVALLLLLLYVAFGGRFGFEQQGHGRNPSYRKGNYGTGNAYDQYYDRRGSSSYHTNYHSNSYNEPRYSSYEQQSQRSSSSYHSNSSGSFLDQWNGHLTPLMLILLAGTYLCHRNGIPIADAVSFLVWTVVFRRRRQYRRGWGGGGMGGGMFRPTHRYRR